jgi:hypothetical protein
MKQIKINYEDEFEINEILKDKIQKKKTKKDSIEIGTRKIEHQPNVKTCI